MRRPLPILAAALLVCLVLLTWAHRYEYRNVGPNHVLARINRFTGTVATYRGVQGWMSAGAVAAQTDSIQVARAGASDPFADLALPDSLIAVRH